jgi:hypothetical protein
LIGANDYCERVTDPSFVLSLGGKISPILTPDEPDAFEATLRDRANPAAGTV